MLTYNDICTSLDVRNYWIQRCHKIAQSCARLGNGTINYLVFNTRCMVEWDRICMDFPELGCFAEYHWGTVLGEEM